jgi:hypothetical protein
MREKKLNGSALSLQNARDWREYSTTYLLRVCYHVTNKPSFEWKALAIDKPIKN